MIRMDEEQAVFEQLTFSDLKMWSSTALKTFYNYNVINNDHQSGTGEFRVVSEHFEDLKNLHFELFKWEISYLVGSCYLKSSKAFSKAMIKLWSKVQIQILLHFYWRAEKNGHV